MIRFTWNEYVALLSAVSAFVFALGAYLLVLVAREAKGTR